MSKIVLIDAYSQIYRLFFAMRMLNDSHGRPVNALFGMMRLLMQLEDKAPSDYGALVFDKGKPLRNAYRKFKIKSVQGPNDYASMKEVLTRRFVHGMKELSELEGKGLSKAEGSFTRFPDVIMMDGGRGQVNIALEVLKELDLAIPVAGMVKDDHHRTRGLYYNNIEVPIDKHSEGFKLITRLQDEAHRFAITYHKALRGKAQVHSFLDDIEGIGPSRRKSLMRHFASVDEMREATLEELKAVDSMNAGAAENLYRYLHSAENK